MIGSAVKSLRDIQSGVLSRPVVYKRGGTEFNVSAVPGRTVFRSSNEYGAWVRTETRDFIVPKELLPFEPQVGDEVEFLGATYEVLAPNGEPAWRWSDAFHTAYRIHAKHTGG